LAHEAALPISNGSIEIRNAVTGEIEHRIELPRPVKRFTLSQVNDRLVVVTEDNSVLSVDVHSGTYHEVLTSKSSVYPITWVHPGASNSLLVYDNASQLTLRNWSDGIPITQFPTQWPAEGTWLSALDPSGRYIAVRSPDNVVRVSRIADGSLASVFLWGDEQVVAFAFNSDGNVLAVLSASGKLGLWNIAQNKAENVIVLAGQYQTYPAPTISLGPGNAQLIVADSEGRVSVVSLVTHDVRVFATGAKEPYVVARVSPDGRFLATYAPSYGLRVWSLGLSEVLLETKPGWSELGSYDVDLRFSADSAFVILQSSYEPSTMIRLPEERDALIRTARRHLANFAAANDNLVQPQASKLRLGVLTSDLTAAIRMQFHLPDIRGAVVLDIFGNNAALAAGLKFGDVITKINDTEITGSASVQAAVNAADTSKNVDIVVLRNGETRRFVTNF
jgi:hypothetical protein